MDPVQGAPKGCKEYPHLSDLSDPDGADEGICASCIDRCIRATLGEAFLFGDLYVLLYCVCAVPVEAASGPGGESSAIGVTGSGKGYRVCETE